MLQTIRAYVPSSVSWQRYQSFAELSEVEEISQGTERHVSSQIVFETIKADLTFHRNCPIAHARSMIILVVLSAALSNFYWSEADHVRSSECRHQSMHSGCK